MHTKTEFLALLQQKAFQSFQRVGVAIQGGGDWQNELITSFYQAHQELRWFCVGEWSLGDAFSVSTKQGHMLLGRECDVLVYDARKNFDANSFSAALGSLVGGGILIVATDNVEPSNCAQKWMASQWQKLLVLEQHQTVPELPSFEPSSKAQRYTQQEQAVTAIEKVVTGHRKRPLVLTADRGRGKSSALGIACANLLQTKPLRVLVTAPSIKAVEPVFLHAERILPSGHRIRKDRFEAGQGSIQFIAPDELLASLPECDLLLVDEAAAIPVPMLQQMTAHFHRLVFSSTIHGYEGCGRGFTLKFVDWLRKQRAGMKTCHLKQPIRWSEGDILESWLYQAFVLDAELMAPPSVVAQEFLLKKIAKHELVSNPSLLRDCFALLVNAHYQTSPNDLLHLLQDECSSIYVATSEKKIVGVIMTVEEGSLDEMIISDIQLGRRRPPGHLAPVTIINQLGMPDVGRLSTLRIMRIAVHPELQNKGLGKRMLAQLEQSLPSHVNYLSTSFGLTEELLSFWSSVGYQPIRLGTMRDAASGCYSLLMVRQLANKPQKWIDDAKLLLSEFMSMSANLVYSKLEPSLYRSLLNAPRMEIALYPCQLTLIRNYALGGGSYESVFVWLKQWLLKNGLVSVSDLMICKLFLNHDWESCAKQFKLTGRKQVEQAIRREVQLLLKQFTL
ncbi:tRNA(Met) cytidine acetyltransferase [Vibrio natriegens]|uniref:tRNA(Met) cytidine acetyltransferase TmcA n=1 Tax=Vibrio natriegens TaxID=691 RepID=UPI001593DADC|nr:GNAT family N-acetyltransferase [Vibrio natriegens]NVC94230.1 tRNA(Met) cytidine acetyltransferase [Vibrio natriegens]